MRFVPAHRSILDAAVSGSPDATYFASWLTDGLPGFPSKTTGNMSHTITPAASMDIDVIAVVSHNIRQAATIALGSGLGNIPTAAYPSDGVPHNWAKIHVNPVTGISSFTLSITGNTDPITLGELYAGLSSTFPDFLQGRKYTPQRPFAWEGEYQSLAPPDLPIARQRRVGGTIVLTDEEFADLDEVHASQKLGSRPILWVEEDAVNDAWLCQIDFSSEHKEDKHFVALEVAEIPRMGW